MRDELVAAIQNRKVVTFDYKGHPRRVQPAIVGKNRRDKDALHAYQVDGGSASGGIPYWRNFRLDDIQNLVVLDEVFGPNPPGYAPQSWHGTYAALGASPSSAAAAPPSDGGQAGDGSGQVVPGLPITSEQAAKAAEQAGKAIAGAAEALGKWFRKRG